MTYDTSYTGPPRPDERYADEFEFERHMNGGDDRRIPGARLHIFGENVDLVIPNTSKVSREVGEETVVVLAEGSTLRSGADESGYTSGEYVRLCDPDGSEVLYYDSAEWAEDPILVMGALMNAAAGFRPDALTAR